MINLDIGVLVGIGTIIVMLTSLIAYIVGIKFNVNGVKNEIACLRNEIQSLRLEQNTNIKEIYNRLNEHEIKQAQVEVQLKSIDRRKYERNENEKD